MTHDEAIRAFDRNDNLFRAGVKIRLLKSLGTRRVELIRADADAQKAIIAAEMTKAVAAELRRDPLP